MVRTSTMTLIIPLLLCTSNAQDAVTTFDSLVIEQNSGDGIEGKNGILQDIYFDEKGDLDRESFLVKIEDQKPVLNGILEPLSPGRFEKCKK